MIFQVLVSGRWLHFASISVLFGSALFWFYAYGGPSKAQHATPRSFAATHRLLCVAAPAAALSGLVWLVATVAAMTSDDGAFDWRAIADPEIWRRFFFETGFGAVWGVRLALLAAAIYSVARLRAAAAFWALIPIGAALLVSQAWLGHAAQGTGVAGAAMTAAYGVHVLAAAAWVGGLAPLLFVVVARSVKDRKTEFLNALSRFSAMGMAAVAAIVVSGAVNVRFRAGDAFGRLFDTAYGGVLAVKLALFGLMLALAAFNRCVAMPRLRGATAGGPARASALFGAVALELALGVLVLGAAALLGLTPPPQ